MKGGNTSILVFPYLATVTHDNLLAREQSYSASIHIDLLRTITSKTEIPDLLALHS